MGILVLSVFSSFLDGEIDRAQYRRISGDTDGGNFTFALEPSAFRDGSKFFRIDEDKGIVYLKDSLEDEVR